MMKHISIVVALCFCAILAYAKPVQRPSTYNYQRGVEAYMNENDHQKALDFLNKELVGRRR